MGNLLSRRKHRQEWTPDSEKCKKNSVSQNGSRKESVEATYATKIATNDLVSSSNGEANKTILQEAESSPKVTPEEAKEHASEPSISDVISKVESLSTSPSNQLADTSSTVAMENISAEIQKDTPADQATESNVTSSPVEAKPQSQATVEEQTSTKPADEIATDPQTQVTSDTEKTVVTSSPQVAPESEQVPLAATQDDKATAETNGITNESQPASDSAVTPVDQTVAPAQEEQKTVEPVETTAAPAPPVEQVTTKSETESVPSVVVDGVTSDTIDAAIVSSTTERILEEVTAQGIREAVELIQSSQSQDCSAPVSGDTDVTTPSPVSEGQMDVSESKSVEQSIASASEQSQSDNVSTEVSSPVSQASSVATESATNESVPEEKAKSDDNKCETVDAANTQVNANVDESKNDITSDAPADDKTKQLDNLNNNSNETTTVELAVTTAE